MHSLLLHLEAAEIWSWSTYLAVNKTTDSDTDFCCRVQRHNKIVTHNYGVACNEENHSTRINHSVLIRHIGIFTNSMKTFKKHRLFLEKSENLLLSTNCKAHRKYKSSRPNKIVCAIRQKMSLKAAITDKAEYSFQNVLNTAAISDRFGDFICFSQFLYR